MTLSFLIAEDEAIISLSIKKIVETLGYDIFGVVSKFDVTLLEYDQPMPDIAIVDIKLKGEKNGVELAKYLYENFGIRSIFISAYSDQSTMNEISALNPYATLKKPFNKDNLELAISNAISSLEQDNS